MASPPGKPVVIVDTFPALVKLAEKYGQMILTWTRPDGADDFVVRDEGILYRYRIDPNVPTSKAAPDSTTDPAPATRSGAAGSATGTTPVSGSAAAETTPVMGLPPAPAPSPGTSADSVEDTTADVGAAPAEQQPPVKKTTPRKRATKTTATKTAAAVAKATAKSTGTRAPAKRTRAAAKPPQPPEPKIETHLEPTVAAAEADLATSTAPDSEPSAAGIENQLDQPTPETERSTPEGASPTVDSRSVSAADTDQQLPGTSAPHATSADSSTPGDETTSHEVPADAVDPPVDPIETAGDPTESEKATGETEKQPTDSTPSISATTPSAESDDLQGPPEPEAAPPALDAAPRAGEQERTTPRAKNQKRSNRRKSRSRRTPLPTVDEPQIAPEPVSPTTEARNAMKDLAERNIPMTPPEPGTTPQNPWPEEPSTPPVRNEEPIYDFLPAGKRHSAQTDDLDESDT
jgi:hypothetical protein